MVLILKPLQVNFRRRFAKYETAYKRPEEKRWKILKYTAKMAVKRLRNIYNIGAGCKQRRLRQFFLAFLGFKKYFSTSNRIRVFYHEFTLLVGVKLIFL